MRTFNTLVKTLVATAFAVLATAGFAAVDANRASQAELESVKSIGPALAGRILDERNKSPFKDWTDMVDRVKGVGNGNAAKFSAEGLTVNGGAFSGAAVAAPAAKKDNKAAKPIATKAPTDTKPAK